MTRRTFNLAASLAALAVAPAGAATSTMDRQSIRYTEDTSTHRAGASLSLFVPGSWTKLRQSSPRVRSFRSGRAGCRYSISLTTSRQDDVAETAAERVARLRPADRRMVLDEGVRGTAGWRVIRVRREDGRVRIEALHSVRRSLGASGRAWQDTTVTATSRAGDECHTGTYRDALGPQIGDSLATARGRVYRFER